MLNQDVMADSDIRKRSWTAIKPTPETKKSVKIPKPRSENAGIAWSIGGAIILLGLIYLAINIVSRKKGSWSVEPETQNITISVDHERRNAVLEVFKSSWSAYERDAYGFDNYHPIAKKGSNLVHSGGIGYMIVDVIDTLQIMNLTDEYSRARTWVANDLSFERDGHFNTFETTIRVLGGLLSAYHLSDNDPVFLERAVDLGERILKTFDTPSGLPLPMVDLKLRKGVPETAHPFLVGTAEVATLQLELKYLSQLTEDEEFWYKAERVLAVIRGARPDGGLVSVYMDANTGGFIPSEIRLGSRGDSYYEYLLKQYLQTERKEDVYREMYEEAMEGIHKYLLQKGLNEGHLYTSEFLLSTDPHTGQASPWQRSPKQDHLVCFLGGSLMLGAVNVHAFMDSVSVPPRASELSADGKRDWTTGVDLIETCMDTYDTATGLSPEIAHFYVEDDGRNPEENRHKDWYIKGMEDPQSPPSYDARYMLRPETVESLFIAYRLTGDNRYRDHGWKIFQAIEKYARVETGGYVTVLDVNNKNSEREDKMETFFLSETLKYLYLLYSDADILPLNQYVFNTEAHPLPKFSPTIRTGFS